MDEVKVVLIEAMEVWACQGVDCEELRASLPGLIIPPRPGRFSNMKRVHSGLRTL